MCALLNNCEIDKVEGYPHKYTLLKVQHRNTNGTILLYGKFTNME